MEFEQPADEIEAGPRFQKGGAAFWFSPLLSSPGLRKRTTFSSRYDHPSVTTIIEPGPGNLLHVARMLGLGARFMGNVLTLEIELSLLGVSFAGVPGHREMEGAGAFMPGGKATLALHPFANLPLKLAARGELLMSPAGQEITDAGGTKEPLLNFTSTTLGIGAAWEIVRKRVLGTPALELELGALYMQDKGEFIPDGTFPGLTFESTQLMYGGTLTWTKRFWLVNYMFNREPNKKKRGAGRSGATEKSDFNFLVLGVGFYTGPGDGYMITWTVDWRMGGSSTE